jgi:hypothetical protein
MPRVPSSKFLEALLLAAATLVPAGASAQACCAGAAAVTPGRLQLHEDELVGVQAKAGDVFGSYGPDGAYISSPAGDSEYDFEEDLFGSIRFLRRGQASLLVPLVETSRTEQGLSGFGGGLGDINLSARYDFVLAGESLYVPGVALLVGVTFPTGMPPDASGVGPLATGATGIGAYQGNVGVAFEQVYGPWLINLTALVAQRAPRSADGIHETLGTQFTGLVATAYAFPNDAAVALSASYTGERDAVVDGAVEAGTGKSALQFTLGGLWPVTDQWRVQGSFSVDPWVSSAGRNNTAAMTLTLVVIRSWS